MQNTLINASDLIPDISKLSDPYKVALAGCEYARAIGSNVRCVYKYDRWQFYRQKRYSRYWLGSTAKKEAVINNIKRYLKY